jgi:hypothetical protein
VEVVVVGAVFAFELNGGVLCDAGDGAVDDGDSFPRVVFECGRADVLALMTGP